MKLTAINNEEDKQITIQWGENVFTIDFDEAENNELENMYIKIIEDIDTIDFDEPVEFATQSEELTTWQQVFNKFISLLQGEIKQIKTRINAASDILEEESAEE